MEKKQITIYNLLPLLPKGFAVNDTLGKWWWCSKKPHAYEYNWSYPKGAVFIEIIPFNIAPFDGDWKDSLMEVK